jgi:hypothetical protein
MVDLMLTPGAPFFALSFAGVLIAALGLSRIERARLLVAGVRKPLSAPGATARLLVGQAAGLPLAGLLLLAGYAGGATGLSWLLLVVVAAGAYLYLGLVVPRRPLARARRERRELRRLTPGLVSYVRVALAGYEAPATLLERYVARPQPRLLPMQAVVAEALTLVRERRLRPFDALRSVARARGCQELIDVAEALAQAEAEGSDAQAALAAHQATLEAILRDEFTRMLKRRTLWLLLVVAGSLVIGILGNLLYVMVAGSQLFGGGL